MSKLVFLSASTLGVLALFVGELELLKRFFTHPAGPQPADLMALLLKYGLIAALPICAQAVVLAAAWPRSPAMWRSLKFGAAVFGVGLALPTMALRQYSHGAAVFLVAGYVAQWVLVALAAVAVWRLRSGGAVVKP